MVNLNISADPLPVGFTGTPQQIFEALLDRLEVTADIESYNLGAATPADDSGPWFKDGTQLWVWDSGLNQYRPAGTDDSVVPQIEAGETEPEDAEFWLRTSGPEVLGLYYFAGTEAGWIAQESIVADGSITTAKLANGSITTVKIGDNAVRNGDITGPIPLTQWVLGTAGAFFRMNSLGTLPEWKATHIVSPDVTLSLVANCEYLHDLDETPHFVTAFLKRTGAAPEAGWAQGDLVPLSVVMTDVYRPSLVKGDTRVSVRFITSISVPAKGTLVATAITPADWKLVFYITAK